MGYPPTEASQVIGAVNVVAFLQVKTWLYRYGIWSARAYGVPVIPFAYLRSGAAVLVRE